MNKCQSAARNFVDMVIDNGQVSDRALSDLNLSVASCSSTFTYEYYREERVTNPDPNNADEVIVLLSSFDVDSSGGDGSLNPNSTYDNWSWILVRTSGGKWKHVDHGY